MTAYPLHPTPHRKAFLRAVHSSRTRVILYHSTRDAYDNEASLKVTERLREAVSVGWIEPVPQNELWPGAHPTAICTYFRLTPEGRRILGGN